MPTDEAGRAGEGDSRHEMIRAFKWVSQFGKSDAKCTEGPAEHFGEKRREFAPIRALGRRALTARELGETLGEGRCGEGRAGLEAPAEKKKAAAVPLDREGRSRFH